MMSEHRASFLIGVAALCGANRTLALLARAGNGVSASLMSVTRSARFLVHPEDRYRSGIVEHTRRITIIGIGETRDLATSPRGAPRLR
jgi:hypothetical protein